MHWDVTKDKTVENMICSNVSKVWKIFIKAKNIMVAFDKYLIPIQTTKSLKSFSVNYHITKVVDFVVRANSLVPAPNHFFIHFVWMIPRAKLRTIVAKELAHPGVPEVGIANKE
jgi:hypothetical protein